MKILLSIACCSLFASITFGEVGYYTHSCNANQTLFEGTNYIQKLPLESIVHSSWNPAIDEEMLPLSKLIQRGQDELSRLFPKNIWTCNQLYLQPTDWDNISGGWQYIISYEMGSASNSDFSGFSILVMPDGVIPPIIPDKESEQAVPGYPPQGVGSPEP